MRPPRKARGGRNLAGFNRRATKRGGMQQPSNPEVILAPAFSALEGVPRLMAGLLYGAGLRLLECARLRVQDLDFVAGEILVRDGKGAE